MCAQAAKGTAKQSPNRGGLLDWLQLFRIANLPSALSNILMAYLLANGSWTPVLPLMFLLLASASLYTAGMVLNDVFDISIDREHRPHRPLASGAISVSSAKWVGWGLLIAGLVLGGAAGFVVGHTEWIDRLRPGATVLALAICIYLYDSFLKQSFLAPWLMGLCRGLNILLGASTHVDDGLSSSVVGFSIPVIWLAASVCVLIAGVTWLARRESKQSARFSLAPSGLVLILGIAGIAVLPLVPHVDFPERIEMMYPILILLVSIPILRKTIMAVVSGHPNDIQMAVVSVLRSLIIFDASVCYLAAPGNVSYAIIVVCLLLPSLLLGRRIQST